MEARLRRSAPPGTEFFGRVDAATKDELIGRAHVLIATSVREGWGLVVDEAAEAGTFVLAYDVPGLRDSVTTVGGRLTRPDPTAMARSLVTVLRDDSLRTLSPAGAESPSWPEVADSVLRHLERALSKA
jgi:glycosyltransferase involved in cell wall biosynthesis